MAVRPLLGIAPVVLPGIALAGCAGVPMAGDPADASPTPDRPTTTLTGTDSDVTVGYRVENGTLYVNATGPGLTCDGVAVDVVWQVLTDRSRKDVAGVGVGHRNTDDYRGWVVTRSRTLDRPRLSPTGVYWERRGDPPPRHNSYIV